MEGHDVFTQRNEIGDEDPFAGSDFGDWEQVEPSNEQTAVAPSGVPAQDGVENPNIESGYDGPIARDGEVSPNHPAHPQWHQSVAQEDEDLGVAVPDATPAEAQEPSRDETVVLSAPAAASQPPMPLEAPPAPPPPPSPSQAAAAREDEAPPTVESAPPLPQPPARPEQTAPAPSPEPSPQAAEAPQPTPADDGGPRDPVAAQWEEEDARREEMGDVPIDTRGLPEPAPTDAAPPEPEEDLFAPSGEEQSPSDGEAPVPDEMKDKRGRVTHRRYVILRHEGKGRFTQLAWFEDKQRKLTKTSTGAKRQTVVLARGTEEALKFGYLVEDGPRDGVDLVAVAAAYFQVRHVAPEPPEPAKQRLKIS